jgi:hypothetical protein
MAKVVIVGVTDEKGLWIADLDAGTIVPLADPTVGNLKTVSDLRASGASVVKGVDVAISIQTAAAAASGHLDG